VIDLDISKEIGEFVGDTLRTLALDIDRRVILESPVDTGAARSNWLASTGSPLGAIADIDVQGALNKGAVVINGANDYETIYVQNNLPYIQRLNEGWSEQAPSGYIDKIILEEVQRGGN
jgi:hypothetical protein